MAKLPAPSFDRAILTHAYETAATATERVLTEMWEQMLGLHGIARQDDFFDLGGDSLMAVEMFLLL